MKSRKGSLSGSDSDDAAADTKSCGIYEACWFPKNQKLSPSDDKLLQQSLNSKGVPSRKVAVFFWIILKPTVEYGKTD